MITPETIITAELLAGLEKCPFCGERSVYYIAESQKVFECGSGFIVGNKCSDAAQNNCLSRHEITTLSARVAELEAKLHRLTAAGDAMFDSLSEYAGTETVEAWTQAKAKEAK